MLMRTDVQDLMDRFARSSRTTTVGPSGSNWNNHRDLPKFNKKYIMRCGFLHQHTQMAQTADRLPSFREEYGWERQNLAGICDCYQRECRGRATGCAQESQVTPPFFGNTRLSGRSARRATTDPLHRGRCGQDGESRSVLPGRYEVRYTPPGIFNGWKFDGANCSRHSL